MCFTFSFRPAGAVIGQEAEGTLTDSFEQCCQTLRTFAGIVDSLGSHGKGSRKNNTGINNNI